MHVEKSEMVVGDELQALVVMMIMVVVLISDEEDANL